MTIVCMMKILSWNIHGVGSLAKKKALRNLLRHYLYKMVFVQETKLEMITRNLIQNVWFRLVDSIVQRQFAMVQERWLDDAGRCGLISVYAPCVLDQELRLWDELIEVMAHNRSNWCVG
ncbi:hypothetical protein V6N12_007686 [Hibiscus sabdariffa]|uniref:Uncharacterized protein n=1 Tax=Hibiscus sabdariffa TaxID=183260 RepID=A0ABR2F2I5_9ROSI